MSGEQHFSGIVTPIPTSADRCGGHVSWGSAPITFDPWGIWWDTDANCLKVNDDDTTYIVGQQGPIGPQGPQGIQGIQGIPGVAGQGYLAYQVQCPVPNMPTHNITRDQSIVVFSPLTAGLLNVLGRKVICKGSGTFTTVLGETPTFYFRSAIDGGTGYPGTSQASSATIDTGTITANITGAIEYEFEFTVAVIGTVGKLLSKGQIKIQLDGVAWTTYPFYSGYVDSVDLTLLSTVAVYLSADPDLDTLNLTESNVIVY